jgi:hypothetical protein
MSLAWPFDSLQPKWPARQGIRRCDAVLLSLLIAWFCYAVYALQPDRDSQLGVARFMQFTFVAFLAVGRLVKYWNVCRPPITFWGRIRTGRWIIPGYDQVFLAPLGTLLAGVAIPEFLFGLDPATLDFYPLFLALALLIAFNVGPSLKVWCLTAPGRLAPSVFVNALMVVKVG